MKKSLILGTAGHIDHGKTALVRLLTDIDCDRLPEEKKRGITIELGFASLDLPDGTHLGVVDVPGHERFVRTMVAGATGIDIILLIIAADEGIMPQTREHFEICRLLGVKEGVVALTKSDLADESWIEMVREDVRAFVKDSFLEDAPVIPVSSVTGDGRGALLDALAEAARRSERTETTDLFRLPVDRVFTMKGFGTVVTGTLISGSIAVGDEIEVAPRGLRARVRGLQVHGNAVERAMEGNRTAVNLQGLQRSDVERGDVLLSPGGLAPTSMADVRLEVLSGVSKPLKMRQRIQFHAHTYEIGGLLYPISDSEIAPGKKGIAQIRLDTPAVLLPHDRFILRNPSPSETIGGGVVLHARPKKHRAPYDEALKDLETLERGTLLHRMAVLFENAGCEGLEASHLQGLLGAADKEIQAAYLSMLSHRNAVRFDAEGERALSGVHFQRVLADVLAKLSDRHREAPENPGITRGDLAARVCYGIHPKLLNRALAELLKEKKIEVDGDLVRLQGHQAGFAGEMAKLTDAVRSLIKSGGAAPPTVKEIIEAQGGRKLPVEKVLEHLVKNAEVVRVSPVLFYDKTAFAEIRAKVQKQLSEKGEIDAQSFKELTGLSRKFAIPLLEYFDALKVTLRVGDKRVARSK